MNMTPTLRPGEMTKQQLAAAIAATEEETNYYDELMAEWQERVMIQRHIRERALLEAISSHGAHTER